MRSRHPPAARDPPLHAHRAAAARVPIARAPRSGRAARRTPLRSDALGRAQGLNRLMLRPQREIVRRVVRQMLRQHQCFCGKTLLFARRRHYPQGANRVEMPTIPADAADRPAPRMSPLHPDPGSPAPPALRSTQPAPSPEKSAAGPVIWQETGRCLQDQPSPGTPAPARGGAAGIWCRVLSQGNGAPRRLAA